MEEIAAKTAIAIALKATVIMLMVSLGLKTTQRDLLQLWRRPRLLAGCLAAAFVVVPVAAYVVFQLLPLAFEAKAGLWVVAITPGAPMIYRAALKRGMGDSELAAGFQVTSALLVVLLAPMWLAIISALSGSDYRIPPQVILKQVAAVQLVPILLGLAIHQWLPGSAARLGKTLTKVGNFSLGLLVALLLVVLGERVVFGADPRTILAALIVAAAAVAGGHYLAGPEPSSRLTIANANAQRNPGLALAIAAWNLPQQKAQMIVVVVTYVLVALLVAAIYTAICRRRRGRAR